jgi:uncharacterized protein
VEGTRTGRCIIKPSRFNLVVGLSGGRKFLLNTLSGAADLVPAETAARLSAGGAGPADESDAFLVARRYLLKDDVDEATFVEKFYPASLQDTRRKMPLHCIAILSFDCNLRCAYCWQQHRSTQAAGRTMTREQADAMIASVPTLMRCLTVDGNQPPLMHLFGGEPLLAENREVVAHILERCATLGWPVQITTNGKTLPEYRELIERHGVAEVQVTVDGPDEIHDRRRIGSRFAELMDSIDRLVEGETVMVKMRVNVDSDNAAFLPELANAVIDRQWYTSRKFYAYVAPLRDASMADFGLIRNRAKLLGTLLLMKECHPQMEIFDFLGWDGYTAVRNLENQGVFPYPKTHVCEANLNQVVFVPDGHLHLCAEEAHDPDGIVGRYWPDLTVDPAAFSRWYDLSPLDLPSCRDCSILPLCGGGCQLLTRQPEFRRHYCDAVRKSLETGLAWLGPAADEGDVP